MSRRKIEWLRIEKADGTIYYRIELEKMNVDLEVNINEDGIVIP
jgi:uncharacterized membrane protein YkoI